MMKNDDETHKIEFNQTENLEQKVKMLIRAPSKLIECKPKVKSR